MKHRLIEAPVILAMSLVLGTPAAAETISLFCPIDRFPGWTYTVDLDYAVGTITIDLAEGGEPRNHFGPSAAAITDRAIKFEMRDSSPNVNGWPTGFWSYTLKGSIDRLAGSLAATQCSFAKGENQGCVSHQLPCRRATQKF